MGRRYYHLWPQISTFENLLLAYRKAARGKRSRSAAVGFNNVCSANQNNNHPDNWNNNDFRCVRPFSVR